MWWHRKETWETICKWHKKTFPDATLVGQIEKFDEERCEFMNEADADKKILELADMYIVACGVERFDVNKANALKDEIVSHLCGFLPDMPLMQRHEMLWVAIREKMRVNRRRKWRKLNGQYKHKA